MVVPGPSAIVPPIYGLLGPATAAPLFIAIPGIDHFAVFVAWLVVPALAGTVCNSLSDDHRLQISALNHVGAELATRSTAAGQSGVRTWLPT